MTRLPFSSTTCDAATISRGSFVIMGKGGGDVSMVPLGEISSRRCCFAVASGHAHGSGSLFYHQTVLDFKEEKERRNPKSVRHRLSGAAQSSHHGYAKSGESTALNLRVPELPPVSTFSSGHSGVSSKLLGGAFRSFRGIWVDKFQVGSCCVWDGEMREEWEERSGRSWKILKSS